MVVNARQVTARYLSNFVKKSQMFPKHLEHRTVYSLAAPFGLSNYKGYVQDERELRPTSVNRKLAILKSFLLAGVLRQYDPVPIDSDSKAEL